MKRRLISALLALALCLCLLPMTAMAVTTISEVDLHITAPVAGAQPDSAASFSFAGYEVTGVSWYDATGASLSRSDTFSPGVRYTVQFEIHAMSGYCFEENTAVRINGQSGEGLDFDRELKWGWVSLTFPPTARDVWRVHFDPNGGGSGTWEWVEVVKGETLTMPECPYIAPEGMIFESWDGYHPGDVVEIRSDMEFKAIWVSAESEDEALHSVSAVVDSPVAGMQSASTAKVPAGSGYFVSRVDWSYNPFDTRTQYVFEPGVAYTVRVMLAASQGYTFAEDLTGTVNGQTATVSRFSDTLIGISITFPETSGGALHSVSAVVDIPVTGMQSASTARVPAGSGYAVSRVDWSYNPFDTRTQYVFEAGVAYSVRVTLAAAEGYTFAEDLTGTVNGQTAMVSRFSDTLVGVSITFPETAPEALPFGDVPKGAWYGKDLRLAYATGLITGTSADSFAPTAQMTYAQAVTLAARMRQLYTDGVVTLQNGSPKWYDSYVSFCKQEGIIDRDYDWNAPATRAEFVEIFARALPAEAFPVRNRVSDDQIPDVKTSHAQAEAIYLFYRAGILTGYPTADQPYGEFRPDNPITRAEVSAILTRMMYADQRIIVTAG